MKIDSLMIHRPITVSVHTSVRNALELMKSSAIRHLPVVDATGDLKGLLTLSDLKQALLPSMLSDLTLADMMITNPITVAPSDDIEYAARIIYKHKISGLPVTKGSKLVGIITESDILRAFIDMMGIITNSTRIDIITDNTSRGLNKAIQIIEKQGCDIINVGMSTHKGTLRTYHFRLSPCDSLPVTEALAKAGYKVQLSSQQNTSAD
jgi:acetoin utilization protein AcuB